MRDEFPRTARSRVPDAALCMALFLGLAAGWVLVVPVAEAPDEAFHVLYAAHIARERRLPVMDPPQVVEVPVEGNQPPLYYLVGALVLRTAGAASSHLDVPPRNPRSTKAGGPEASVYDHRDGGYRWSELERAVRILRLAFLPAGALVVLFTYMAAQRLRPEERSVPLLAAGFAATVPQFSFIMGSVTNDVLANAIAAAALAALMIVAARGRTEGRDVVLLGVLVGLGLTAKMTLLFLVPAGLIATWLGSGSRRRRTGRALAFLALVLLVASPVLVRYQLAYGDPFGLELNRRMFPERLHEPGFAYWAGTFVPALFFSFWGVFGHMNIHLGEGYALFGVLAAAAAVGLVRRGVRGGVSASERRAGAVIAAALLALLASIVQYNLNFPQPQGRYLFPGMVALAVLLAVGVAELLARRLGAAVAVVALMAAVNALILAAVVAPAYAR